MTASTRRPWRRPCCGTTCGGRDCVMTSSGRCGTLHVLCVCYRPSTRRTSMAQVSYRSQERRARELLPWGLLSFVSLARRAASRSDIWTRVRATVESAVSSRRCIAKGCPHVRHPWLRRERFGMMRPSWGLERARGGALAPNACTLEPYLCDAALCQ